MKTSACLQCNASQLWSPRPVQLKENQILWHAIIGVTFLSSHEANLETSPLLRTFACLCIGGFSLVNVASN